MYKNGDKVLVKATVEKVTDDYVRIYAEGYGERSFSLDNAPVEHKTYSQGLADAWKLAKKVYNMKIADIDEIFGVNGGFYEVMRDFTYEETLAKIEAYEFMQKIQEGDVVEASDGIKGVVAKILPGGGLNIIHENGLFSANCPDVMCKKTGKHIDIERLLRQIGE